MNFVMVTVLPKGWGSILIKINSFLPLNTRHSFSGQLHAQNVRMIFSHQNQAKLLVLDVSTTHVLYRLILCMEPASYPRVTTGRGGEGGGGGGGLLIL